MTKPTLPFTPQVAPAPRAYDVVGGPLDGWTIMFPVPPAVFVTKCRKDVSAYRVVGERDPRGRWLVRYLHTEE